MILFRKYSPSPKLIEFVHYYFVLEFGEKLDESDDQFLSNHPQGTFDLMFALRGGIKLSNYKDDTFELSKIFIMAQQEGYFNISFPPNSQILGIVFYAESFSKLFNLPLAEMTNSGINVEGFLSEPYQDLYTQLLAIENDPQKNQTLG